MVKGLSVALITCCVLTACTDNDTPNDAKDAATVTAADTANVAAVPFREAKIDSFALRLKAGDVYRYRVTQFSEAGPDSAVATSKSVHVYTKTVRKVRSDGSYEISMRFDTIRVDLTVKNRTTGALLTEQHYTSTDSSQRSNANYMQFNALLGEDVSIFVDPKGVITEVGDVAPIVTKMLSKAGPGVTPAIREQVGEQIKQAVYMSFYGQEHIPLPSQAIDSTGSWSIPSTNPIAELFTMSSVASYHIDGVRTIRSRRVASITGQVKGSVDTRPLPKNAPFSVKILSSTISGTTRSLLDVDGGFTIAKKNAVTFSVTARLESPAVGTKNVSQTQVSRYEIELLP